MSECAHACARGAAGRPRPRKRKRLGRCTCKPRPAVTVAWSETAASLCCGVSQKAAHTLTVTRLKARRP